MGRQGVVRMAAVAVVAAVAGAAAAEADAYAWDNAYQVNETVASGGIDLVGGGWATDALRGPATDALVSVTGAVTHAANLSAGHPFVISNGTENAKLTLKDAGLLGVVPLRVVGASSATTYFDGETLNVDETTPPSVLSWDATCVQLDSLTVSSRQGPAVWTVTNDTFYVRNEVRIGCDGGTGTVVVTRSGLGRSNGTEIAGLGKRDTARIYLGAASASGMGVSSGTLHVKGGTVSSWRVYMGSANVPAPAEGAKDVPNLIQLDGGNLLTLHFHQYGARDTKIAFNGGAILSQGWGNFINFENNASGDLIFEGQNGKPIDVVFNKFAQFAVWNSTATGRLIFRGDSNVYLYGGDFNAQDPYDAQILEGSIFSNRADGQGYVWEQTGDLLLKPASGYANFSRLQIKSDGFLPHNPENGGVAVQRSSKLLVNLMGTTQNCNSLFGGGFVTNTSAATAVLNIGENGNNCQFDVEICPESAIDVNKLGTGEMVVSRPIPGAFSVRAGRVVVTNSLGDVWFGTLDMAAGTVFAVRGGVFAPPAGFDLAASGTGDFELAEGGTLKVGGDADGTLDLSRVTGDMTCVIEKVGQGTLTLLGASAFRGTIRVSAGQVSVAEGASLGTLAAVTVADDATLDLASGVAICVCALDVRGTHGAENASYSGSAENAEALAGLTGGGTITVVASSALWTGAVDDDAAKIGNWQDLSAAPELTACLFSPVFAAASDDGGTMEVGAGYGFNGISFTADITAFTFKSTGADSSLAIAGGGLSFPDEATARTITFDTPLAICTGSQVWNVTNANTTLDVNGPLGDVSSNGAASVVTMGSGTVNFRSANSTYTGSVSISNAMAYAWGDEPFGPSNRTGTAALHILNKTSTRLMLANTRISKPVVLHLTSGSGGRYSFGFAAHTTNVFYGPVTWAGGGVDRFSLPASSTVVFAGGYGRSDNKFYVNWDAAGTVVVSNRPFYASTWESNAQNLRLHCPGNVYGNMVGWTDNTTTSYNPYSPMPVSVDFRCDWGFDLPTSRTCIRGLWDLHGHPQRVGAFFATSAAVIQSYDGPATFYVNQHKWHASYPYVNSLFPDRAYPVPPSQCRIRGEVSLCKTGPIEFGITNRVIEATGTVTVAEGPFTLWAGAVWPGATNVVVSGGTFRLTQANQLSPEADYHLTAGVLQLDEGATQKARYLWLDDGDKPIARGVWGALDNESLPVSCRTARIAGAGTLLVRGDGRGLTLVFR
ncbi:MAG: hypothetical protein ACI4Q3_07420 [Kiritimatiellia bacterium]